MSVMYADVGDLSDSSEDTSTIRKMSPNTRQNFRRNANLTVCLLAAVTMLVFNVLGALVFYFVEQNGETSRDPDEIAKCVTNFAIGTRVTAENRAQLEKCLRKRADDTKIDNLGEAMLFAWTLYSTVGYGTLHAHTSLGRFLTAAYSFASIPVYIAFKFEFGTLLARFLLVRMADAARIVWKRAQKLVHGRPRPPDTVNAFLNRDQLIFLSAVLVCTASLLASSALFVLAEPDVTFGASVYFGVVTAFLIGLGDVVPQRLGWFALYTLLFLVSDVLSNQIFYFCQAKIRAFLHFVARRILLCMDEREGGQEDESTVTLNHVPVINTQCMPNHTMDCEKDELDKDEKLLTPLTL